MTHTASSKYCTEVVAVLVRAPPRPGKQLHVSRGGGLMTCSLYVCGGDDNGGRFLHFIRAGDLKRQLPLWDFVQNVYHDVYHLCLSISAFSLL